MAEERLEETADGWYVRSGDVLEWKWSNGPGAEASPAPAEPESERPTTADPKGDWEDYAARLGIDVEGLTKAELVEAVRETEEGKEG